MICIIDYGMGNLRSVQKAIEFMGGSARVSSAASVIANASALILPGVGAFGEAMKHLRKHMIIPVIKNHVAAGKPFLGICLGYQLLFTSSTEGGRQQGLGMVKGTVKRFPFKGTSVQPVPQMGWNKVTLPKPGRLFDKSSNNGYFYFVHSFYTDAKDPDCTYGYTQYGITFKSVLEKGNVFGCQFHPEKSGEAGLRIIKKFVQIAAKG